ncbi:MAG TPA: hypothetical protein VFU53_00985 [Burkholderiales bacterium]|nr:hypothetical protein [Burkholderiales bacterium]
MGSNILARRAASGSSLRTVCVTVGEPVRLKPTSAAATTAMGTASLPATSSSTSRHPRSANRAAARRPSRASRWLRGVSMLSSVLMVGIQLTPMWRAAQSIFGNRRLALRSAATETG